MSIFDDVSQENSDSRVSLQSMAAKLSGLPAIQLYSDYINNFRINQGNVQ